MFYVEINKIIYVTKINVLFPLIYYLYYQLLLFMDFLCSTLEGFYSHSFYHKYMKKIKNLKLKAN